MPSRVYIGLAEQSGRDGVRAVLARGVPSDEARPEWARSAARWADVAGAPRWVKGELRQAGRGGDPDTALWAGALWLRGWASDDFDALRPELARSTEPGWSPPWRDLPRKHDARGIPRPDAYPPEWWEQQRGAVDGCRETIGVFAPRDRNELHGLPLGCGARSCPRCSKAAQWRAVSRYLAAFAAPLRTGAYRLEMFTLGSLAPVGTPSELRAWRSRLGAVCRAMTEGRPGCGIEEGSWVGGLVVVETVHRQNGQQFAHAHLLIVARRWYAWGLSEQRLDKLLEQAGVPDDERRTPGGRLRITALRAAATIYNEGRRRPVKPEALLGLREVQRRMGVGQVGQHDFLEQPQGERIDPDGRARKVVLKYLSKVQQYAAKVADDGRFWSDPQIQWCVKGLRRCQPFGAFMRWHAGPTRRGSEVEKGADDPRALAAIMEPADFAELHREREDREQHPFQARVTPDPAERFEWHRLNRGWIWSEWATWAHVGDYLRALEKWRRPAPPALPLDPRPIGIRFIKMPALPVDTEREMNPTGRPPRAEPTQVRMKLRSTRGNVENGRKCSTPERNRTSDLPIRNGIARPERGDGARAPPREG